MRILFAGTPIFAEQALCALVAAGHRIALVLTQPDRPAGRGMKLSESAVKRFARQHGLDVFQPPTLRDPVALERLRAAQAEAMVVAAYGLILPQEVIDLQRYGALNIHASLLPRWRGAAPIQRAILAGDAQTGITIMQMDAGLDTGAMLARRAVPIGPDDDAQTLHDRLAALGAQMIVEALRDIEAGKAHATPQPAEGASYARKIDKRESELDWRKSDIELHRKIRAFNPVPGAHAALNGAGIKVWRAHPVDMGGAPGAVLAVQPESIVVACGERALALTELQRAGGRRLSARQLLVGFPIRPGERFDLPA